MDYHEEVIPKVPCHTNTKAEIKEDYILTSIKIEPGTSGDCDLKYQKPDIIEEATAYDNTLAVSNILTERLIKDELGTSTSDTLSFQSAVTKTEEVFESKYIKEDQSVGFDEGISSTSHMITQCASPSSSYELKYEEADLGVMKMEEDQDTTSESTELKVRESGEQCSAGKEIRFVCLVCSYIANDNLDMQRHRKQDSHKLRHSRYIRTHGGKLEITFDCIKCQKKFSTKRCFDGHIVALHNNNAEMMENVTYKIHRCKQCRYITVTKSHLIQHMRTHGEQLEAAFDCTMCEKEFSHKRCLDNHIVTRHSNNPEMMNSVTHSIHRCKYCRYMTVNTCYLTRHMRMHGGSLKTTLSCVKCKKEFSSKKGLDGHIISMHSNSGEIMKTVTSKIHRCSRCKYITIYTSKLFQHMTTHGERLQLTFGCIECEMKFSSKRSLDGHIVTLHTDNAEMMKTVTNTIHHCKHCTYITVKASRLTKHIKTHQEKSKVG